MSLLRTEGQIKEELLIGRRKNPDVPTAYEISRKNYVNEYLCRNKLRLHATNPRKTAFPGTRKAIQKRAITNFTTPLAAVRLIVELS